MDHNRPQASYNAATTSVSRNVEQPEWVCFQGDKHLMRNVRRALVGVTATFALGAGIVGTTTGSAAAYTGPSQSSVWALCTTAGLKGCMGGSQEQANPNLKQTSSGGLYHDSITSIQTNQYALHTWNDAYYKGTYGYFAPNWRWDQLNSPYDNTISSFDMT